MKKILLILFTILLFLPVKAQPPMMGGMGMGRYNTQSFYMAESDSIAKVILNQISDILNINTKQTKKMSNIISQEYEATCRIIQMSVMENMVNSTRRGGMYDYNFGGVTTPVQEQKTQNLDTVAVINNIDKLTAKYEKRYKRVLEERQFSEWSKFEKARKQEELSELIQRVYDNTENIF
ncbi:MAG TPA: hypothetical protein VFC94_02030 [Bacteroidaceae bacterium]|nr:hypothetical protein [Bacteroidaceae bacterium]